MRRGKATRGMHSRHGPKRVTHGLHDKYNRQLKSPRYTKLDYCMKGLMMTQLRRTLTSFAPRGGAVEEGATAEEHGSGHPSQRRLDHGDLSRPPLRWPLLPAARPGTPTAAPGRRNLSSG